MYQRVGDLNKRLLDDLFLMVARVFFFKQTFD